ncbi:MAG: biotin/lipoyl-containing protein [Armatimonadota bacterium]|nr:biotin/lipoyl-containing protein [Armatimonadota bacterium]MDR7426219.1 biotin/lipoyl-containing protein [Armatimonadota bacterium]MDR7464535.1 biotin/lipoyl-containing protein [Armatimonadota bacterium]MDR7469004.1 biotin/lipoyl-containing protein [Armatimonadota bacterium]MDR7474051.1 biotin/lipoyl-containing protein [Armatimonadota bacterium]
MKYVVSGAGLDVEVEVVEVPGGGYRVRLEGKEYDVRWNPALGGTHWWLEWDSRRQVVVVESEGDLVGVTLAVDHLDLRVAPASPLHRPGRAPDRALPAVEVRAPMPGLLVAVEVRAGQAVGAGEAVAVIEAMKMQMELRTPAAGTVREVRASAGGEVSAGDVIVVLQPDRAAGAV